MSEPAYPPILPGVFTEESGRLYLTIYANGGARYAIETIPAVSGPVARCAWLDEADRLKDNPDIIKLTGISVRDDSRQITATVNADAWRKWSKGEPWK